VGGMISLAAMEVNNVTMCGGGGMTPLGAGGRNNITKCGEEDDITRCGRDDVTKWRREQGRRDDIT